MAGITEFTDAGSLSAMALSDIERRLERGVEGFFGRVFRSGVRPVELGRKLVREMDSRRTVGVNGKTIAPNAFTFEVSEDDYEQLADMLGALRKELIDLARSHAKDEGYRLEGPIEVDLVASSARRPGLVGLEARFHAPEGGPTATLLLPNGNRVMLDAATVTIGRHSDCTIILADPNASRHHAEIRQAGEGFTVVDLGSTNGTQVNGARVAEKILVDGDVVTIGSTVLCFESDLS